jgi:hypothetical protein
MGERTGSEGEYEVERIVDHKKLRNKLRYLVHWAGYGDADDTWEPADALGSCPDAIAEYWQRKQKENSDEPAPEVPAPPLPTPKSKGKAKPKTQEELLEILHQKGPQYVIAVWQIKGVIFYRVHFEDGGADTVSSALMRKVAPALILRYMESLFTYHYLIDPA